MGTLTTDIAHLTGGGLHALRADVHAPKASQAKLLTDITTEHGKALTSLEARLTGSKNASERALGKDLKSGPQTPVAEKAYESDVLNLIATGQEKLASQLVSAHKAAIAALAQEMYAAQLTKDSQELEEQATALKDQTTQLTNYGQDQVQLMQAQTQKIEDQWSSATQALKDAAQVLTDQMQGVATAVKDATTLMSDQSSGIVGAINDQTQIQVDTIGERGLFGLNLIAQQLTVQLDVMKASYDQQISLAQQQLDVLQATADSQENQAQVNLDQVTQLQDAKTAIAQGNLDSITIAQDQKIATAQAHVDAVQLHEDTAVIGPAQIAVDMNANASKAQQDVFAAQLAKATGSSDQAVGTAQKAYQTVYNNAQQTIGTATQAFQNVSGAAQYAIQQASSTLTSTTDYFNIAIARATQSLTGLQDTAAQQEAPLQGQISTTQAQATTQYAGSGLVVNVYGTNLTDPATTATEIGWVLKTQLPN